MKRRRVLQVAFSILWILVVGGITYSRGHSGDNAGRTAIVSLLTTGTAEQTETFVFGCSVF